MRWKRQVLALLFASGLIAAPASVWSESESGDRRSEVVARLDCASDLASRDLTLFANGTVRLRQRDDDGEEMRLGEMTADELEAVRRRLLAIDFSETHHGEVESPGEWSVGCRLMLEQKEGPPREFEYGQFDSLPLSVGTAVGAIQALEAYLETSVPGTRLPLRYEPRAGDILERWDGVRFEVKGLTVLGSGVELSGVEVPLTIYMPIDELPRFFVALEFRRDSVKR